MIQVEMVDGPYTCTEEDCENDSSVFITCEMQGYQRAPFCVGHAHCVFADWMVGVE